MTSGRARETFDRWAAAQGADAAWLRRPETPLAPVEHVVVSARAGVLAEVDTRGVGLLLGEAGGGRSKPGDAVDPGIALRRERRLGDRVEAGEELARVYLRRDDTRIAAGFDACFRVGDTGAAPVLVQERIV